MRLQAKYPLFRQPRLILTSQSQCLEWRIRFLFYLFQAVTNHPSARLYFKQRKEWTMREHYDVIIIGTGAGGGTLAYKLAGSGKHILLLERGDFLPREKENWDATSVFAKNKYTTMERWYDGKGKLFQPGQHYYVGGNTKFFGAVLFRMRRQDLAEIHHHGGTSPAWPIAYEDLEPYYTEAEKIYHVRGVRGEDPTEPSTNAPYAYPAINHEPRIQMLADAMQANGLRPFHLPMGVRLNEALRHKSLCIRCETCDGFPCLVNAKSDAHIMCINPALEHANVTLVTNAKVTKLETDASGRTVTGLVAERDGQSETFSGDIIVVSAGAINSSVLLLKSANEKHPDGLANSSGVVGRHYMAHHNTAFIALSGVPNDTIFQKTLGINDFYLNNNDWGFPMGHIQMLGKSTHDLLKAEVGAPAPRFSYEWIAEDAIDFWLTTEDLPDPDNRVTLHRDGGITLIIKSPMERRTNDSSKNSKMLYTKFIVMTRSAIATIISSPISFSWIVPSRWQGSHTSVEPYVLGTTQKRPPWISTAKPTT
jgi:choline dehydrogenase-like flavoprotein